jgi:hypothetical protein
MPALWRADVFEMCVDGARSRKPRNLAGGKRVVSGWIPAVLGQTRVTSTFSTSLSARKLRILRESCYSCTNLELCINTF